MHIRPTLLLLTALAASSAVTLDAALFTPALQRWEGQRSGTGSRLRGLSVVSPDVAWASGAGGTVLRTVDGGRVWQRLTVPGADGLDFRDVDAMSATTAYVLSIGNGADSRIYKTSDAGLTWTLQFQNDIEAAFFDAMAFWDEARGIAVSDSVDGRFVIRRTTDGGAKWARVPGAALPPALDNEGAFAASGTNVAVAGTRHVWIATGAASRGRVLRSEDGGETWTIADTPLASGSSSGAFSIAFRDTRHGVIVGGDYAKESEAVDNVAVTSDGGRTWRLAQGLGGYRSGVAYVPTRTNRTWMAVGPTGTDVSTDDGRTWTRVSSIGFDAIAVAQGTDGEPPAVFGSGANGRIGRLAVAERH